MLPARSLTSIALLFLVPVLVDAAQCPTGTFSSTGQTPNCVSCAPGTFQNSMGGTSCLPAPAGSFAFGPNSDGSGASGSTACSQGTYQPLTGQAACLPCPPGSFCNGLGRSTPQACPPGRFSDTPGTGLECPLCAAGQFQPLSGQTSCCSCCAGTFQSTTGQPHCQNCPVKGSSSPLGATSSSQCGNTDVGLSNTCDVGSSGQCPGGASPTSVHRRAMKRATCPSGHKSCPVYGSSSGRGFLKAFECVDVRNDLESCGGCVYDDSPFGERSADGGRDCSAIPYVDSVTCTSGECIVRKCREGYVPSADASRCMATRMAFEQETMKAWRRKNAL